MLCCSVLSFTLILDKSFNRSLSICSGTDDVVGPEGMEKFCEDIGVEPENVRPGFFFLTCFKVI